MKIVLQPHLKIRLEQRNIPPDYPKRVIIKPDTKYFDILTNHSVAVKRMQYNGKLRPMAVSYDLIGGIIQVITIHPISEQEIENKLKRGRWIQNEED